MLPDGHSFSTFTNGFQTALTAVNQRLGKWIRCDQLNMNTYVRKEKQGKKIDLNFLFVFVGSLFSLTFFLFFHSILLPNIDYKLCFLKVMGTGTVINLFIRTQQSLSCSLTHPFTQPFLISQFPSPLLFSLWQINFVIPKKKKKQNK